MTQSIRSDCRKGGQELCSMTQGGGGHPKVLKKIYFFLWWEGRPIDPEGVHIAPHSCTLPGPLSHTLSLSLTVCALVFYALLSPAPFFS